MGLPQRIVNGNGNGNGTVTGHIYSYTDVSHLDDADDYVLEARPFRIVMEEQLAILLRAAEGGSPHSRIQGAQVVVQGVQILIVAQREKGKRIGNMDN